MAGCPFVCPGIADHDRARRVPTAFLDRFQNMTPIRLLNIKRIAPDNGREIGIYAEPLQDVFGQMLGLIGADR